MQKYLRISRKFTTFAASFEKDSMNYNELKRLLLAAGCYMDKQKATTNGGIVLIQNSIFLFNATQKWILVKIY